MGFRFGGGAAGARSRFGNVLPCNGTEEQWIMGNLNTQSWNEIWNGREAENIRRKVDACRRECAFIGTARFDMKRRPWKPLFWILRNKMRLRAGKDIIYS